MADIYHKLGQRVRQERLGLDWTQEELGSRCGMHPSYIGQIERGVKKISISALDRLARALRTRPGDLLNDASPSYRVDWNARIQGLLRDRPEREKRLLYSTLRHLAREMGPKK